MIQVYLRHSKIRTIIQLFPDITLGENSPKKYWHLEGCQLEINGTLEYRNKTEEYCLSKYTGTEYVVYQEKTGCSTEITFHPINEHQTPFHSNGCKKSMKAAKNQWKRYKCERREEISAEEIVQKMDNKYVYYYCFTENTTINGITHVCENKIYKIKKGEDITINNEVLKFHKIRMEHFTNIETEFSETINSKVFRPEDVTVWH